MNGGGRKIPKAPMLLTGQEKKYGIAGIDLAFQKLMKASIHYCSHQPASHTETTQNSPKGGAKKRREKKNFAGRQDRNKRCAEIPRVSTCGEKSEKREQRVLG